MSPCCASPERNGNTVTVGAKRFPRLNVFEAFEEMDDGICEGILPAPKTATSFQSNRPDGELQITAGNLNRHASASTTPRRFPDSAANTTPACFALRSTATFY